MVLMPLLSKYFSINFMILKTDGNYRCDRSILTKLIYPLDQEKVILIWKNFNSWSENESFFQSKMFFLICQFFLGLKDRSALSVMNFKIPVISYPEMLAPKSGYWLQLFWHLIKNCKFYMRIHLWLLKHSNMFVVHGICTW